MAPFDSSHCHGCFVGIKAKHADDGEYGSWLAGYIHTFKQTYLHTYMHTYIPTYIPAYIHTIGRVVQQWAACGGAPCWDGLGVELGTSHWCMMLTGRKVQWKY
jgi:hypothetical protein